MSGVVKFVKKDFSRKLKSFKKTWKYVAIAVAVYFTAGLALAAMPATAGFAAAMPGISAAAGGLGVGGAGAFSAAAVSTGTVGAAGAAGAGAGAAAAGAGAAAAAGTIPEVVVTAGAAGATGGGAAALGAGAVAAGAAAGAQGSSASAAQPPSAITQPAAPSTTPTPPTAQATPAAAKGGMTLSEKLLVASTLSSTVSGLAQPSAKDIAEQQKRWSGAFYGVDGNGSGGGNVGPLIPTNQATFGPNRGQVNTAPPSGVTVPKRTVPTVTQQKRDALVRAPAAQQSVPYQYGRDTLIPTSDAPFESLGEDA